MEIYLSRIAKARTVTAPTVRAALTHTYPSLAASTDPWTPVCLLLEAKSFWLDTDPTAMDVIEVDPELGRFDSICLELTLPALVTKIRQDIPNSQGNFLNVASATILAPVEFTYDCTQTQFLEVGCAYLFNKLRGDGTIRRHAPPALGGRILHKPKYPQVVYLQPDDVPLGASAVPHLIPTCV